MTQRLRWLAISVVLALTLAACNGSSADTTLAAGEGTAPTEENGDGGSGAAPECSVDEVDGPLNFYNWSDYIDPDLITAFEEQYDVDVVETFYDSNETMIAQIQAGVVYDLIVPSDYMVAILIEEGMIAPLNKDAIPTLENVSEQFQGLYYDETFSYSVPYQWGTTGLGVNLSVLGTDFPRSWALVFDPELTASYPSGVSLLNDPRETIGAAMIYLGYSLNETSEDALQEAGFRVTSFARATEFEAALKRSAPDVCLVDLGLPDRDGLALVHRLPAAGLDADALLGLAALACRGDSGDPLDEAILALVAPAAEGAPGPLRVFPFTEARRRETALWPAAGGAVRAVTKGAPETVLALCTLAPEEADAWRDRVAGHADAGHKVIAFASRTLQAVDPDAAEPDAGFAFAGLLVFADPLRAGVRGRRAPATRPASRVIMVTGDHPALRAPSPARRAGRSEPRVATMDELGQDEAALAEVDVVARAVPAQKLELVQRLQRQGEIVAVTGDGVNDAPALQAADIGIAMGGSGSQSSRELASIVLLDDNFRTIVGAIAEGRQLFRNLQSSFAYLLVVHLPLVLTAALVPLAGQPLLYLPIHIVWLELLIHPTALLAFQDPPPPGRMAPADRGRRAAFFGRRAWAAIVLTGLAVTAAVLLAYRAGLAAGDPTLARTLAMATLVLASVAATAVLSRLSSPTARAVALASAASLVLLVQVPALADWVHLRPLGPGEWALAAVAGLGTGSLAQLSTRWSGRPRRRARALAGAG